MNAFFKIGLPWAISLGLVFFVGLYLGSQNAKPSSNPLAAKKSTEAETPKKDVSSQKKNPSPELLKDIEPVQAVPIPNPTMPPNLQRIIQGGDIVERLGTYLDAVRSMDRSNVSQVVKAFEELPGGYGRHLEMKLLMRSWANFDPVGALAYASNSLDAKSERRFGVSEALAGWAIRDSEAAIAWAEKNHPDNADGNNPLLIGIVKGLAETNLQNADALMKSLPSGSARWQASTFLAQEYSKGSIEDAVRWAESYPDDDSRMRETIVGQVGANLAKRDLQATAAWASTMQNEPAAERVMENVITHWVSQSPEEAAQWVNNLEESHQKTFAMRALANRWAIKDPVATAEWINQLPSSANSDLAINEFVNRIRLQDPEGAAGWANSIQDEELREKALKRVIDGWKETAEPSQLEMWKKAQKGD